MQCVRIFTRAAGLIAGLTIPLQAVAHAVDGARHWWTLDPWVCVPLLIFCALYLKGIFVLRKRRRSVAAIQRRSLLAFSAGTSALFLALIWPLDALGGISFAAHMAQHMLLIAVAAPLLALAGPSVPIAIALSGLWPRTFSLLTRIRKIFRTALRPGVAFSIHAAVIWIWHAPLLFEAATHWQALHIVEHVSFLGSGMLFWAALGREGRSGGDGYGIAALWTLATLVHTGMLGALITFSPRLIYSSYSYSNRISLSPIEDQQLAGLIMWIPAGLCYLIAGVGFAAAWLRHAEERSRTGLVTRQ